MRFARLAREFMKTQVTTVCDLEKELPPDAPNAPEWLVKALQVPREEGFVESQGCDIHYFRWGNPENPPLLMMHGFLAHARCMAFRVRLTEPAEANGP